MGLRPVFDKPSRKDLVKELRATREQSVGYLRALAAVLIDHNGELRIPAATFALLDPEMVVQQQVDAETREVVFRLIVPKEAEASVA